MNHYTRRFVCGPTKGKKYLLILLALVVVIPLLWGRLMLKQVPRMAVATPATRVPADAPLGGWVKTAGHLQAVYVDLPEKLNRDLFAVDLSLYQCVERPFLDGVQLEKSNPKLSDGSERKG